MICLNERTKFNKVLNQIILCHFIIIDMSMALKKLFNYENFQKFSLVSRYVGFLVQMI